MLIDECVIFFSLHGPFEESFYEITLAEGHEDKKGLPYLSFLLLRKRFSLNLTDDPNTFCIAQTI